MVTFAFGVQPAAIMTASAAAAAHDTHLFIPDPPFPNEVPAPPMVP
jgi:hypothetical protein